MYESLSRTVFLVAISTLILASGCADTGAEDEESIDEDINIGADTDTDSDADIDSDIDADADADVDGDADTDSNTDTGGSSCEPVEDLPLCDFFVTPALQVATPNTIGVVWKTKTETTGKVQISVDEDLDCSVASDITELGKIHKVIVEGLEESTQYYYRVVSDDCASEIGSFSTALPKGSRDPFRFVVYGDTRTGPWYENLISIYGRNPDHLAVATSMLEMAPDFAVHVGDIVFDGTKVDKIHNFFKVETDLLANVPLLPAYGNHEFGNGSGQGATLMDNYLIPAPGGTFSYYSYNWGNVHILVLNTGENASAISAFDIIKAGSEQQQWAEADLAAAAEDPDIDHIFVSLHAGIYSCGGFGDNAVLIESLVPLFLEYGVKAVFMGHDHNYQHQTKDGVHYLLTGGGGSPITIRSSHGSAADMVMFDDVLNYLKIDVNGEEVTIEARKVQGGGNSTSSVLETFEL